MLTIMQMLQILRTNRQHDALVAAIDVELVDREHPQVGQRQGFLAANQQREDVEMVKTLKIVEHFQMKTGGLGENAAQSQVLQLAEHRAEQLAPVDRGRQRIVLIVRQKKLEIQRLARVIPAAFAGGKVVDDVQLFVGHFVGDDRSPSLIDQPFLDQIVQIEIAEDCD